MSLNNKSRKVKVERHPFLSFSTKKVETFDVRAAQRQARAEERERAQKAKRVDRQRAAKASRERAKARRKG